MEYFTSLTSNVFCVQNLPEVVKGALFSKYSRSYLGLRELFQKEFNETLEEKSEDFYDRILDGFGDDSIAELGGAHLAIEGVSMLAAKVIEDCRIGGSPLEKSTRYIYFDKKDADGNWKYYRDPDNIMESRHADSYIQTCDHLFEVYSDLVKGLKPLVESKIPRNDLPSGAYQASVRAKTLDLLRGLLPASALTNMGVYGNGRFFSGLLSKLDCSELNELKETGLQAFTQLEKVVPAFIRRSETSHRNQVAMKKYVESIKRTKKAYIQVSDQEKGSRVNLVGFDPTANLAVATALCFEESSSEMDDIAEHFIHFSTEDYKNFFQEFTKDRTNRRHKSPRSLEAAEFMFEIVGDFGMYRDLQRHRTLTQERQRLTCDLGYFIPEEILGTEFEGRYRSAMDLAKKTYDYLAEDFREEAQYVVPMAYNIRWYFKVNLRALQWICELRSMPQGHENYRRVAQQMAREVCRVFPEFECFFGFVDFEEYPLGRLQQELGKL